MTTAGERTRPCVHCMLVRLFHHLLATGAVDPNAITLGITGYIAEIIMKLPPQHRDGALIEINAGILKHMDALGADQPKAATTLENMECHGNG
jgi:hypothetical protein